MSRWAGTDLLVEVQFVYSDGELSKWFRLNNTGDDREQNQLDEYSVNPPNPSVIANTNMRVKHMEKNVERAESWDSWRLETVSVWTPTVVIHYTYDEWITVPRGMHDWQYVRLVSDSTVPRDFPLAGEANATIKSTYTYSAPPMAFGPWVQVGSYCGPSRIYTIDFELAGDTQVVGQVKYYRYGQLQVIETILSGISITTAPVNVCANIYLRFKGVPPGSQVDVEINS